MKRRQKWRVSYLTMHFLLPSIGGNHRFHCAPSSLNLWKQTKAGRQFKWEDLGLIPELIIAVWSSDRQNKRPFTMFTMLLSADSLIPKRMAYLGFLIRRNIHTWEVLTFLRRDGSSGRRCRHHDRTRRMSAHVLQLFLPCISKILRHLCMYSFQKLPDHNTLAFISPGRNTFGRAQGCI